MQIIHHILRGIVRLIDRTRIIAFFYIPINRCDIVRRLVDQFSIGLFTVYRSVGFQHHDHVVDLLLDGFFVQDPASSQFLICFQLIHLCPKLPDGLHLCAASLPLVVTDRRHVHKFRLVIRSIIHDGFFVWEGVADVIFHKNRRRIYIRPIGSPFFGIIFQPTSRISRLHFSGSVFVKIFRRHISKLSRFTVRFIILLLLFFKLAD